MHPMDQDHHDIIHKARGDELRLRLDKLGNFNQIHAQVPTGIVRMMFGSVFWEDVGFF